VSKPHLALLLDEICVCVCAHLYHMLSARAKPVYKPTCVGQPKHLHKPFTIGILSILECLKVHVLQSVESSMGHTNDHGPCLPSRDEGGKHPKRR